MMEKNADKISLLVDGELDECDMPYVVRSIKNEETARARWANYHLIGDALRGNLPERIPVGLAECVARALEREPVFMNPQFHSPAPATFRIQSRDKARLGFALAASLSAIAVFGVGMMEVNTTAMRPASQGLDVAAAQQATAPIPVAAPAPAVQLAVSRDAVRPPMAVTILAKADDRNMQQAAPPRHAGVAMDSASPVSTDLYDYLVNYHRYAPGSAGGQDMLSNVQLVGYGPRY